MNTPRIGIGDVVLSTAGHDQGTAMVVVACLDAEFVLVCDGKTRTLQKPKRKKRKHLKPLTAQRMETVTQPTVLDAHIRKHLKALGYGTNRE